MFSLKLIFLAVFLAGVCEHVSAKKYFPGFKSLQRDNGPPAPNQHALMARYIVHNADWTSLGTTSVTPAIKGYPFIGLKSIADGPVSKGTGVPYMLMTDMDVSMIDLNHDNRCTLFMTLAQGDYCKNKEYDPQDPRCARVMLTGSVEKIEKNSDEEAVAKNALYSRHPAMRDWPTDHQFFFVKLNIVQIALIDFFGGIKHVTPTEYYAANEDYDYVSVADKIFNDINVFQIKF